MESQDIAALERRFGIPGVVRFREGPAGIAAVEVGNSRSEASIALQGAHLYRWAPKGREPVIWLSPLSRFGAGKSIRGGVPICWPWFGPHESDSTLPAHGFARTAPWETIEAEALPNGATRLGFRLLRNESNLAQWRHSTPVEIRYVLGDTLEIELLTRNLGPMPIILGEALHTYFSVSDVREIAVEGLEGIEYLDKVNGGRRLRQAGAVRFSGEVDRVYLDTGADCTIVDPGLSRRIRIEKQGSRSTVVWNPWKEKAAKMGDFIEGGHLGMVCVESANAVENLISLEPGEEHRLWVRYSVENLA